MSIVKSYHSLCFLIQVNVYTSFKTKLPRSLYSASHKVQQARKSACGGWGGDGMGGGGQTDRQTENAAHIIARRPLERRFKRNCDILVSVRMGKDSK